MLFFYKTVQKVHLPLGEQNTRLLQSSHHSASLMHLAFFDFGFDIIAECNRHTHGHIYDSYADAL